MKYIQVPESNQAIQKVASLYILNITEEMGNIIKEKEANSGWQYRISDYLDNIDGVVVDHCDTRFDLNSIYLHIYPEYDNVETFTKIKNVVKDFASKK